MLTLEDGDRAVELLGQVPQILEELKANPVIGNQPIEFKIISDLDAEKPFYKGLLKKAVLVGQI
jgi:hypothetical protein